MNTDTMRGAMAMANGELGRANEEVRSVEGVNVEGEKNFYIPRLLKKREFNEGVRMVKECLVKAVEVLGDGRRVKEGLERIFGELEVEFKRKFQKKRNLGNKEKREMSKEEVIGVFQRGGPRVLMNRLTEKEVQEWESVKNKGEVQSSRLDAKMKIKPSFPQKLKLFKLEFSFLH